MFKQVYANFQKKVLTANYYAYYTSYITIFKSSRLDLEIVKSFFQMSKVGEIEKETLDPSYGIYCIYTALGAIGGQILGRKKTLP